MRIPFFQCKRKDGSILELALVGDVITQVDIDDANNRILPFMIGQETVDKLNVEKRFLTLATDDGQIFYVTNGLKHEA